MNRPGAPTSQLRSHLTLALCTILHGFTHAYGSMLVPLYFRIADDLKLSGVGAATLIVTLYGAVYNLASYAAGLAADRFSRKTLLAIGLLGNAAAILAIGLSRQYSHNPDARRRRRAFRNDLPSLRQRAGQFALPQIAGNGDRHPRHRLRAGFLFGPQIAGCAPRRRPGNFGTSPNGKNPASKWRSRGSSSESFSSSSARCVQRFDRTSRDNRSRPHPPGNANGDRPDVPRFRRRRRTLPGRDLCPQCFQSERQPGRFVRRHHDASQRCIQSARRLPHSQTPPTYLA